MNIFLERKKVDVALENRLENENNSEHWRTFVGKRIVRDDLCEPSILFDPFFNVENSATGHDG